MNQIETLKKICCCPHCHGSLDWHANGATCGACHKVFAQHDRRFYFSDASPPGQTESAFLMSLLENRSVTSKAIHHIRKIVTSEYRPHRHLPRLFDSMDTSTVVVDCGSGNQRLCETAINVDQYPFDHVDIVSDIERLPFARESVDVCVLNTVLEHVQNPQRCVDEAHRVLKSGGRVLCITPFIFPYHPYPKHYWNFTEDGLRLLFRHFSSCEVEMDMGPTSALVNLMTEYVALTLTGKYGPLYAIIKGMALLAVFPFKYVDYLWRHSERAKAHAMCLFSLAEK